MKVFKGSRVQKFKVRLWKDGSLIRLKYYCGFKFCSLIVGLLLFIK